ncbi:hypothetical protein [Serratia oryzae]|uniref:hypothetical protein n=1 Tax=Serratia oryzae TaxID=2034155 RepID=UPI0012E19671|nr:hypothetical protein [Serratia oryzae]
MAVVLKTGGTTGGLEEEISQAYETKKLNSVISELQANRDALQSEKERLDALIVALQDKEKNRKSDVAEAISKIMIRLLMLDLPLQTEFISPTQV